jgi:hypothetical protein
MSIVVISLLGRARGGDCNGNDESGGRVVAPRLEEKALVSLKDEHARGTDLADQLPDDRVDWKADVAGSLDCTEQRERRVRDPARVEVDADRGAVVVCRLEIAHAPEEWPSRRNSWPVHAAAT